MSGGAYTPAIRDMTVSIGEGEILGIVGESGSGKSTFLRAMIGLTGPSSRVSYSNFDYKYARAGYSDNLLAAQRGREVTSIFQHPVDALNPSFTIRSQFGRIIRRNFPGMTSRQIDKDIVARLEDVGVDGSGRLNAFPFQFSQGQLQRIMIAMACASDDLKLLLADEPTTSLDVTVQAQVLKLLKEIQRKRGLSIVLVTHDLGVLAEICDRAVVMYNGRVVEDAAVDTLLASPQHPYTKELIKSIPPFPADGKRLHTMRGESGGGVREHGCNFVDRCAFALGALCEEQTPLLIDRGHGHRTACHLMDV